MICEKSIPILPDALVHKERLFFRNEGVSQYVPQVVIMYDDGVDTPQEAAGESGDEC